MKNIYNYEYDELNNFLIELKEKSYRLKQIWQWLYKNKVLLRDVYNFVEYELRI